MRHELAHDKHLRTLGTRNADLAPQRRPAWPPRPMARNPDRTAGGIATLRLMARATTRSGPTAFMASKPPARLPNRFLPDARGSA
ncbi:MAG: hypothetical protein QOI63_142 [Thermoplasmata archaeon]|nr:hypothetical protein [Thermoplasmata archaeon]